MLKYELLHQQLLYEGLAEYTDLHAPTFIDTSIITQIHDSNYWQRVKTLGLDKKEERKLGLPQGKPLLDRVWTSASGTYWATQHALENGVAMNLAGGTHHAYADRCEGFCVLNDVAIAAQDLLIRKKKKRILVVDLDVHQGNGTAHIFQHMPEVFTFSVHGATNYPLHKEHSDLDIALPEGTRDEAYLSMLDEQIPKIIDWHSPDIIFYIAGADVLAQDRLGKLSLSKEGCAARDEKIIERAATLGVPLVVVLGGGYAQKMNDIVQVHAKTYALLNQYYR